MQKKYNAAHTLFGFLALAFMICLAYPGSAFSKEKKQPSEKDVDNIVAKVNGQPIYASRLEPLVEQQIKKYRRQGSSGASPELVASVQQTALDRLIDQELLRQESAKLKIPDLDKRVKDAIKAKKEEAGSEERYQMFLNVRNLTPDLYEERVRQGIVTGEYLKKEGLAEIKFSDEELKTFYEQIKGSFKRNAGVHVSHILVAVDQDAKLEEKEQARKKAEEIKKKIAEGADFGELADKESNDVTFEPGGDLGFVEKGFMPPEFEKVAFAMKPGEISDIVETRFGFHLIKFIEKREDGYVPFEEARNILERYMQGRRAPQLIAEHTKKLREKANVEIFLTQASADASADQ